ncbi:methyltransferase domain-containing protein [Colletotrichum incanum]|uniref:Methyltransferase domain-containing protein n=1 Tax=Colletotrichum incanum TaxID=1573173 RepID=A0A167CQL7_COLIC|nr:methyltransferase domain-containing protein [Colletotrichum incanum]
MPITDESLSIFQRSPQIASKRIIRPKDSKLQQRPTTTMTYVENFKDGWDVLHHLITHLARVGIYCEQDLPFNSRVLDYEPGTGIWTIELCRAIGENGGKIYGYPASKLQPEKVNLENLCFLLKGENNMWEQQKNFDLIHTRVLPGDVRDWGGFYEEAHRHLNPGGFLEIEALNLELFCDCAIPTLDPNLLLNYLERSSMDTGKQHLNFETTEELLMKAGFINIKKRIIELPINPWDKENNHRRELGRFCNLSLQFILKTREFAPPGVNKRPPALEGIYYPETRAYCTL